MNRAVGVGDDDHRGVAQGRLYFRVIEGDNSTWTCRRGRNSIDHHDTKQEAIDHMTVLATLHRPSEVLVHYHGGGVEPAVTLL